jgi:hypothetical protein
MSFCYKKINKFDFKIKNLVPGSQVMYFASNVSEFLKSRSPKERATPKRPCTRPSNNVPPFFSILSGRKTKRKVLN